MQYGMRSASSQRPRLSQTRGERVMTGTKTMLRTIALATLALPWLAWADCLPVDWNAAQLKALKADGFKVEEPARRSRVAAGLLACLSDPDPELRDGIAFEAWSTWLRSDQLAVDTRLAAITALLPALDADAADPNGFRKPFAALVLSELARADRKAPYLSAEQRDSCCSVALPISNRFATIAVSTKSKVGGMAWRMVQT